MSPQLCQMSQTDKCHRKCEKYHRKYEKNHRKLKQVLNHKSNKLHQFKTKVK